METQNTTAAFRCFDCGGAKSTEQSVRCWDCALLKKKENWREAVSIRAKEIVVKRDAGMTMVEISLSLGVSRQRVYQILNQAGIDARRDTRGGWQKKARDNDE